MTVQWIDTPNTALASLTEPIDFAVTSEPACISVSFGPGCIEERAYRDGAFLPPYEASAGGWPLYKTAMGIA